MKIVLLSGKKGSGKSSLQDELARIAHAELGWRVAKINFADVLYEIHNFTINRFIEYGVPVPEKYVDRDLLQYLGTEWGRNKYGENIWVDIVKGKVGKEFTQFPTDLVIIADARFENEFDAFPDATTVRLVCPEEVRKTRCKKWGNTEHPSETGLDKYDEAGYFDLYLYTNQKSTQDCAQTILNGLVKL